MSRFATSTGDALTAAARIALAIAKNFPESILVRVEDKEGGALRNSKHTRE